MLRRFGQLALAVVVLSTATARAQWGYPGGYGGFGWGGWGATTALGDEARGMGMFAAGMGQYNLNTAQAISINTDTAMRFNEYMWQSQQIRNQQYYRQLAERRQRVNETAETTFRRLNENPETRDIQSGDALNVILDQITAPGVYARSVSAAQVTIPTSLVKQIPFQYAPQAITISLQQLATQVPDVLKTPEFAVERTKAREIIQKARAEAEEKGEISPETLQAEREAIRALHDKVRATIPNGDPRRRPAENFLKAVYGLTRMLETPQVGEFLRELDKMETTNLAALIGFMHTFNLRFGAARTPQQRNAYDQLFPMLRDLRGQLFPQGSAAPMAVSSAEAPDQPERAHDFFSGMDIEEVQKPAKPPVANPPAAAPPAANPPGR